MATWNPWRGCHRYSEGCKFCYIHKGDAKRGIDTNVITKTANYFAPIEKNNNGQYKMKSGSLVYLCFSTDFLIEDADLWRSECWKMIKERSDLNFLFLTKRITRFEQCAPEDWGDGYDNVIICCTIENQGAAEERLPIFSGLPIKHKCITAQPMISPLNIEKYLDGVESLVVGGESDRNGRTLNYDWVLDLRNQCISKNVAFSFRQLGTNFLKDGRLYKIKKYNLTSQAKKAQIDYNPRKEVGGKLLT